MTNKTDKELAVEIAIAYIEASGGRKNSNGSSIAMPSPENVQEFIRNTHKVLKELN